MCSPWLAATTSMSRSIGATTAGRPHHSLSHVTIPYSLVRALTDTTKITEKR